MNIVFKGTFGSHLYGLATPTSDVDVNSIYLVFNEYHDVLNSSDKDLDQNVFSIQKYYKMLCKADTVSIDMLHTPWSETKEYSPLWTIMQKNRSCIYSKNMRGIIGYIKTQASKYGHKVQRLSEMKDFLKVIKNGVETFGEFATVKHLTQVDFSKYKFISYTKSTVENGKTVIGNIDVCGSRYQITSAMSYIQYGVQNKIDRYGTRSEKGSVEGGDFKSLSHAYRVLSQLEEIIDTRDLIFPLKNRKYISKIKAGEFTSEYVSLSINDKFDVVMEKLNKSDLPENSDISPIRDAILNNYF
jgi:hypothetical protein